MKTLLLFAAIAWPADLVMDLMDAFRTHDVVALGEGSHGNVQSHDFRTSLVKDRRFPEVVRDIVVEFGSARYQDAMDRFIEGGEVLLDELRHAWMDTTQPDAIWDAPIYQQFFQTVRDVNRRLPKEKRLRVLLGDPPIDWSAVRNREDLDRFASKRDEHAAEIIRNESLRRGRRALVIYGDAHFARSNSSGIVARLEKSGAKVFAIHTETRVKLDQAVGSLMPAPNSGFDAVLYLGEFSTITFSRVAPELCAQPGYLEMRLARMALIPPPPGAPVSPSDRLKEYCRSFAGRR